MDGFEVNKVLGALLGTALLFTLIGNISAMVYNVRPLKQDAFPVEVPKAGASASAAPAAPVDLGTVLAAADVKKGEQIARSKCTACHTLDKGQAPATGPNLYGVVGAPVIRKDQSFNYSSAMQKFGGDWTFDRLWHFLAGPREFLPGTAMTFVGLPNDKERADVIAWLRTNSDSPVPLPAPAPKTPEVNVTPAGKAPPANGEPAGTAVEQKNAPAQPEKPATPPTTVSPAPNLPGSSTPPPKGQ
jgi:cytochrome c